ncbi:histidinol-phosphatase HisJ family protein [Bacillota bacterium LX-D]|nr:histidinol-phosphatase HisJ family protein [Bacillota bacterium LX-D]
MLVDLHTHPLAHGTGSYDLEYLLPFLEQAQKQKISVFGFSDHDLFLEDVDFSIKDKLNSFFPSLEVRLGLEVNYDPVREPDLKVLLKQFPFDYLIGSVHDLDGWMFDHPDYMDRYEKLDIDEFYSMYFSMVEKVVLSDLYPIIGHLDLAKVFAFRPTKNIFYWVEPLLQLIKKHDKVVEINSTGLFKPVGEIYPEPKIIERMFALNIPITIGSDAHEAEHVGRAGQEIYELLRKIGYNKIAIFTDFKRDIVAL